MTDKRFRELACALDAELHGTGVQYIIVPTSKHTKVHLLWGGVERVVVMSTSPSDYRVMKNRMRDVRHTAKQLTGATQ